MKKLLILILFIGFSANAQNPSLFRNGIDTKFIQIDTLTTTQRDALNIPNNKSAIIYNSTVGSLQYKSPSGSWENIGGGDVESVNSQTGVVVLDADDIDDTSTTNKFVTATEKGLIATALQTETDPIFNAWDKDYNDLTNKPAIPTKLLADSITVDTSGFTKNLTVADSTVQKALKTLDGLIGGSTTISADSVFVSPTIRGIDNAYDLLYAYKTSIDSIQSNMNTGVNTAFRSVTSTAGVFTEAFNDAQPNFELSLDEDVEITITSAVNGNFIIAELYNDDVSEDDFLVTLKGTNEDLTANINFGERAYFTMITNADDDIVWLRSYEKGYKPTSVINSATIYMDGDSVYDDTTDDASTITLSNCDPGETLKVYINRASAPTLAGTDLVFNQLPNTTAFESATDMVITFIVTPLLDSGDKVIDYYYTER